ncbi:MAG: FMN-binding protein [Planctomycetales bacterium]|nr:FMN-binding protein [Planctomycetales bacterium]
MIDRRRNTLAMLVHGVRACVIAGLLLMIPSPITVDSNQADHPEPPDVELIRQVLPDAAQIESNQSNAGFWIVNDAAGHPIARVARTLPEASDVIGYRGPTEGVIILDDQLNILGVNMIQSADTDEHVAAVRNAASFYEQFRGWKWTGPNPDTDIDAVSGATLTSLALAEGVIKRIGGKRPSLVFPDAVTLDEIAKWFPDGSQIREQDDRTIVMDQTGRKLGEVIRSGPLSDSINGYQGPTELLIALQSGESDAAMKVTDIKIRSSFDNEPYVRYCKTEAGFWSLFKGKTVNELATMDLQAAGVEGVSGATMTSMAIAETMVAAMGAVERHEAVRQTAGAASDSKWHRLRDEVSNFFSIRPSPADWGCLTALCLIPLFRFKGWFRSKRLRIIWLLSVIGVVGLWSGNLVSMALVAGWSGGGVAWRLAPALAAIAMVAFAGPVVGKGNPYCNHLCPHGAIQQLIRPTRKSKRHWKLPAKLLAVMKVLPGTLLVFAYLSLLRIPSMDLSSWEPFHAYLFRIAPWSAIALAGLTILFSAFVPMGYCRLGCPTGRLLDHLRRNASSDRLTLADGIAIALLLLAVVSQW